MMIETTVTFYDDKHFKSNKKIILGTATAEKAIDHLEDDIFLICDIESDIKYLEDTVLYMSNYFEYIEVKKSHLKRLNDWLLQLKEDVYDLELFNTLHSSNKINSYKVADIVSLIDNTAYYYIDCIEYDTDFNIGYFAVNELGLIEISDDVEPYFDYKKYGRDLRLSGQVKVLNEELIILN